MRLPRSEITIAVASAALLVSTPARAEDPPKPLPTPSVRLSIVAPSPRGPWTMRIDNKGETWVRIPADARLLTFTVESGDTVTGKGPKPVTCKVPADMKPAGFPEPRALLLGPGETYLESFDPRLFCFGKDVDALVGSAIVRASLGFSGPAKKQAPLPKAKKKDDKPKAPDGPFVVEDTSNPHEVEPLKVLSAPTIVLSFTKIGKSPFEVLAAAEAKKRAREEAKENKAKDDKAKDDKAKDDKAKAKDDKAKDDKAKDDKAKDDKAKDDKAKDDKAKDDKAQAKDDKKDDEPRKPPRDENAARLTLKSTPFNDASAPERINLSLNVINVGGRPIPAVIRPKMFAFRIEGPDGPMRCDAMPASHAIPREMFKTMKPGASTSLAMLLAEVCPAYVFRRPGLYQVSPVLHALESGEELDLLAYTGVVPAEQPSLVRLHAAKDPYHRAPPKAVKMPDPEPDDDEEEEEGEEAP